MSIYFKERCGDCEEFLKLKSMGLDPVFNLFKDMLMIDVYLITGLIKSQILTKIPTMEMIELEPKIAKEELENCTNRENKRNKKEEKLLIKHYYNILNDPKNLEKTWDAIKKTNGSIRDLLIFFFVVRGKIICHLDNPINMTMAIFKIGESEIKNKKIKDIKIKEFAKGIKKELYDSIN